MDTKLIQTKVCTNCKKELPTTSEYFYKSKRLKSGLRCECISCGKRSRELYRNSRKDKSYYLRNKDKINKRNNFNHGVLKELVISHYDGCCAVCGESRLPFLTMDHINNDGGGSGSSGSIFYRWLKRNNFPPGFQVLCWNHNFLKQLKLNKLAHTVGGGYSRKSCRKFKQEVMSYYGGRCQCCGESNVDLLTIDHVNNDGAKHRRTVGFPSGDRFYTWIRNNNFPQGLQVLCCNCNSGRHVNGGVCPHKESV